MGTRAAADRSRRSRLVATRANSVLIARACGSKSDGCKFRQICVHKIWILGNGDARQVRINGKTRRPRRRCRRRRQHRHQSRRRRRCCAAPPAARAASRARARPAAESRRRGSACGADAAAISAPPPPSARAFCLVLRYSCSPSSRLALRLIACTSMRTQHCCSRRQPIDRARERTCCTVQHTRNRWTDSFAATRRPLSVAPTPPPFSPPFARHRRTMPLPTYVLQGEYVAHACQQQGGPRCRESVQTTNSSVCAADARRARFQLPRVSISSRAGASWRRLFMAVHANNHDGSGRRVGGAALPGATRHGGQHARRCGARPAAAAARRARVDAAAPRRAAARAARAAAVVHRRGRRRVAHAGRRRHRAARRGVPQRVLAPRAHTTAPTAARPRSSTAGGRRPAAATAWCSAAAATPVVTWSTARRLRLSLPCRVLPLAHCCVIS